MGCRKKTDELCCKICEKISKALENIRKKKKGFKQRKGFIFSLDALFAVIIATSLIGATFFLLSHAQQDYLRELQMAQIGHDTLLVLDEKGILASHNKSDIKHALIENLPTNFGARLTVYPYVCEDASCTTFNTSAALPPYEILKGYQTPVDVMMIMDTSSSMSDDSPHDNCFSFWCFISGRWGCTWCTGGINDSKEAAVSFLDFLYFEKDRGGLATFGTSAELKQNLTSNKGSITSEINAIDVPCRCDEVQQTALGDGIDIANQEFQNNGRDNAEWIQIVLSDGKSNTGQDPLDAAQDAADENITIYTIGLGSDADEDTLESIANITGGKYYYSPSGEELEGVYTEIAREIFRISLEVVTAKRSYLTLNESGIVYYCEANMGVWLI